MSQILPIDSYSTLNPTKGNNIRSKKIKWWILFLTLPMVIASCELSDSDRGAPLTNELNTTTITQDTDDDLLTIVMKRGILRVALEAIYKPDDNENDSWEWNTGKKEKEDLTWLIK